MELINSNGNDITGLILKEGKGKIVFKGIGNKLIVGGGASINNLSIVFRDSNATLEIGEDCKLMGSMLLEEQCQVKIGARTKFNKLCRVHSAEKSSIEIGPDCLFANVRFRTSDSHSIVDLVTGKRTNHAKNIHVGERVWIAENVFIYKGVNIGSGSIIGAGSVVFGSIPENSLAGGVPAKVLKRNVTWNEKLL